MVPNFTFRRLFFSAEVALKSLVLMYSQFMVPQLGVTIVGFGAQITMMCFCAGVGFQMGNHQMFNVFL